MTKISFALFFTQQFSHGTARERKSCLHDFSSGRFHGMSADRKIDLPPTSLYNERHWELTADHTAAFPLKYFKRS